MKKSAIIIITISVLFSCVTGGYVLFDNLFPEADTIPCPTAGDISSVSLSVNSGSSVTVDPEDYERLLSYICDAVPTRRTSVNDSPAVKEYYILHIITAEREYRYYIYEEGSQTYTELPYEGIYKVSSQLTDYLEEYMNCK